MGFPTTSVFTRVCHVKHGYDERAAHIARQFARHDVPLHFYLDWDVPDISDHVWSSFVGSSDLNRAEVSLALKHVGIWREFLATDMPFCLVFEDDVFLASNFQKRFNECLTEFGSAERKAVVYLGNGGNYYTATSALTKGKSLYPASHARCTDSYLITRPTAQARCAWFAANTLTQPIDHQVNLIDAASGVEILWFERPIVEQGSHSGAFLSSINVERSRPLWWKRFEWNLKKYRRMLFGHRRDPAAKPTR